MDRRIKLVFADEIGRFLERKRGFSSCWYLVPRGVKLVGDLAYEIMAEFELLGARCPAGVELVLENLLLLPNQDIRIVRDNDAICVQCGNADLTGRSARYIGSSMRKKRREVMLSTSSDEDDRFLLGEDTSDAEVDRKKRRKRQLRKLVAMQQKAEQLAEEEKAKREEKKKEKSRRTTRVKKRNQQQRATTVDRTAVVREVKKVERLGESSSDGSDDEGKEQTARQEAVVVRTKKRKAVVDCRPPAAKAAKPDTSSSSDSSSSSSSSSDAESEEDEKTVAQKSLEPGKKRPRTAEATIDAPTRPLTTNGKGVAASDETRGAEREPRQRRRRRPRHRKPREAQTINLSKENVAIRKGTLPIPPGGERSGILQALPLPLPPAAPQRHTAAIPAPHPQTAQHKAETRSTPQVLKGHVRFGDAGETEIVRASDTKPDGALNVRKPRASVPQELHKYGPSPSTVSVSPAADSQQTRSRTPKEHTRHNHSQGKKNASQSVPAAAASKDDGAPANPAGKRKKAKWDEMWKRPYEIVATIHDKPQAEAPRRVVSENHDHFLRMRSYCRCSIVTAFVSLFAFAGPRKLAGEPPGLWRSWIIGSIVNLCFRFA